MHAESYALMQGFAETARRAAEGRPTRVLDVGSMNIESGGTYRPLFEGWAEYTGLDVEPGPNVDLVVEKPYNWEEIPDRSFDLVVSGQALEHIEYPWITVGEIARVLVCGGITHIIVPSRGPEHRYPLDCYRFFPDGLRALVEWAGMTVLEADYGRPRDGDVWGDCWATAQKGHVL